MMRITTGVFAFAIAACSWGSGSSANKSDTPDAAVAVNPTAVCGDGICSATEINSCPVDCAGGGGSGSGSGSASCGNGTCDAGETIMTCPSDCSGGGSGSGSGSGSGACPADTTTCLGCAFTGTGCPAGLDMNACLACLLGGGGGLPDDSGCTGGVPDGTCDATESADPTTCTDDCT